MSAQDRHLNDPEAAAPADAGSGGLAAFVTSVAGASALRVEERLGDGYVRLRVGEAERRQAAHDIRCVEDVVIEMLRNARDAQARTIYVATTRSGDMRTITMLDDGCGIPEALQERVFDARVTSKLESAHVDRWGVHGRGMALFSIRENAREARVVASAPGLGSSIRVTIDCTHTPERRDQSSWPVRGTDDEGTPGLRGPHNIARTCCEFALEQTSAPEVFLGSPAEVLATLRARGARGLGAAALVLADDLAPLPVCARPAAAADATSLARVAASIGIDVSERNARRVITGEVAPLRPVSERFERTPRRHAAPDLVRDRRGLRLADDDATAFARLMSRDFSYLADRYYLELKGEPRVRVRDGRLTVTFELVMLD